MSTEQGDPHFSFRAVLIKIQSLLSNEDRQQLHFVFADDIPRCLQSDGSLNNALVVLQTLLDRLKISKDDCGYLVRGLRVIDREDCAQRLLGKIFEIIEYNINETMLALDYQRLVSVVPLIEPQQSQNATTVKLPQNTSSKVPTALELLACADEEDSMSPPRKLII
jgi:hypothetical protein